MSRTYEFTDTLLKIEDVSLAYGEKVILRNVNAEIKDIVRPGVTQGQVVGFLGPSGLGKTQLFRVIAGLQSPTSGRVLVNKEGIPTAAGLVGVVAQDYPLFAHHTVLKNLTLAAARGGYNAADGRAKAMEYLQRFGLEQQARHYPIQLSGGQRQRVAIMQQLLCSNHFLLMDEPFSGLDPIALRNLIKVLNEIANSHELNTIVVVTHDVEAAVEVSDTLWLLGRELDAEGALLPGARIIKSYNLIDEGLAWREDVGSDPRFHTLTDHLKRIEFPKLQSGVPASELV